MDGIVGKELYSFRSNCEELGICCHKNVNRILELMVKYPDMCVQLQDYVKYCLNMEKMCTYLCDCCCNCDCVTKHMVNEYELKCKRMIELCNKLNKQLSKKDSAYIRCDTMCKFCKKKTSKKSKKKN